MTSGSRPPSFVVGIEASGAGLERSKDLLSTLPCDNDMAFLLMQHDQVSDQQPGLTQALASCTDLCVRSAEQGVELEGGTLYVVPPRRALAIREGRIDLGPPAALDDGLHLADSLFRSLARECGPRSAGILLSGATRGCSSGLRAIKEAGGLSIAHRSDSSGASGTSGDDIARAVDLVLGIEEIPAALARFGRLSSQAPSESLATNDGTEPAEHSATLTDQELGYLAALLEPALSFDLRQYKRTTISRRVLRRMMLSGCNEIGSYFEHLRREAAERRSLVRDLLISVTDFFRDGEAFQALREQVIVPLVVQAPLGVTLRAWIPGCATGEEAYSIGMEFLDAMTAQAKQLPVQIFATDIDEDALAYARAASYPASIAEHVSEKRLKSHFKPLGAKGFQVRPQLRDLVTFAAHDLTKDPPLSRMHLVSCRNVLIYLTPEAQKRVINMLHFALEPDGYLLLGPPESTGPQRDLFSTISKTQRIYKKVGVSRPVAISRTRQRIAERAAAQMSTAHRPAVRQPGETDLARRAVLGALVPPTIVVAADGSLLFSHGELGPYLQIPQGDAPRLDLGSVLRPEIATRSRGALHKCRRCQEPVSVLSAPSDEEGDQVRITARPVPSLGDDTVILTFEDVRSARPSKAERPQSNHGPGQDAIIEQLEKELSATREDLHNTVEELEASNEELRSSNEESMSVNEELQSANEELEATTEELRSLNEELTTVNAQLREKIEQLERAHDDLHNFFSSTKIATLFLDEALCIKRFTPAARELLGIDDADTGRCITDMGRELLQSGLGREVKEVLEHLASSSRDIHTRSGSWITRQVLPYRTESRTIEGVVVTFVDITDIKTTTERLALRERQQSAVARVGLHALQETDLQGFMNQVVRDVQQTLGTNYCKILELQPGGKRLLLRAGVGWKAGLVGSAFVGSGPDSQAGYALQVNEPVICDDVSTEERFSGSPLFLDHHVASGLSCVIRGDSLYGVISAHTNHPRRFGEEDASFLQAIASVVGSVIARYQTRLRLALERGVAKALAESADLDAALVRVIECFAAEHHTSVGEVWWPNEQRQQLTLRLRHVVPISDAAKVNEQFGEGPFAPGEGLVGRVFADGRAALYTDLGEPKLLVRKEGADKLGLVAGLGVPICTGRRVIGVLALFARERLFADEVTFSSLESIGYSIGEFVSRLEFEQRARRLAAITESSHDAILSYDHDWSITEWLSGAERLFGYSTQEMIGSNIERIVPPDRREELRQVYARIRKGELVEPFETVRLRKDGSPVHVSVRISPVKNERGEVIGVSASDRDVTRLKQTEHRLVEADRQKDEFIAMLGHELRNPMAAIRTAAELLKLSAGDRAVVERARTTIERQSTHVAKLLDGLLDVSRIVRGKIQLELQVLDFTSLCREVCSDVMERSAKRAIEIRTDLPSQAVWIEGDRVRVTQIVDNLLSNAVNYTGEGGVVAVSLGRERDAAVLRVTDTGIGIEPRLLPHIFEVFRQSSQNLDRPHGGLGLGLALVKSLAQLHGGAVEAKSEGKDKGSEFVVRLPITSKAPTEQPIETEQRGPLSILIIEDNEDSAEMLRQALEIKGHRVRVATRAEQGITSAGQHLPDVVLCDIGLPGGLSGFDVAKRLRRNARTKSIRLIALTGYGRPEDTARCLEAGFDSHLTKPVGLADLSNALLAT